MPKKKTVVEAIAAGMAYTCGLLIAELITGNLAKTKEKADA